MRCRAEVSTDRLCEARRHDDLTVGTWATQRASTRAPWPGARHARPLRALLLPRAAGHTYLGRRHTRRPALPPILSNGRLVPLTGDPFGRLCRSGGLGYATETNGPQVSEASKDRSVRRICAGSPGLGGQLSPGRSRRRSGRGQRETRGPVLVLKLSPGAAPRLYTVR